MNECRGALCSHFTLLSLPARVITWHSTDTDSGHTGPVDSLHSI
jgi:hypothetical protein